MNRRDFLISAAAAAASTNALEAKPTPKTRRPNVLYVFSDQHRAFSLPGVPHSQIVAPNFQAFRDRNCSMEQCVSNYPLCSPYRAMLMSGLYPQQSGVMGNKDALNPNVGPLGETFRSAGYHTGYIGKWHINGQKSMGHYDEELIPKGPRRMGFDDWHVWAHTDDHYHAWTFNQDTGEKIYPEGWQPVRMTDEAISFMKAQPQDKPWLLVLSWNPPHPQFDPPEEFRAQYPVDQIRFRPNLQVSPDTAEMHKGVRNETSLRKIAQGYQGGITGIDKEFGRVLQALEETGQADNTIIVYTSDHGEMMGSQGLTGKRVPYEESCRVPFIVRYPGVTLERHKSDLLFAAVDIYPTLCGLAGVPVPEHCSGRDLSSAMRGRKIREPEYVFMLSQPEGRGGRIGGGKRARGGAKNGDGEEGEGLEPCPPYRGVRTKTHTYIVADTGRWLLYDNIADPYQMKNLVGEKSQQALMEKLDVEVERWLHSVNDQFPYAEAKSNIFSFS
jgi:arylsulfatase A-like enzyme